MRKLVISLGGLAAAVIAISGAWGITGKIIDDRRWWAKREFETIVIDLNQERYDRECRRLEDRRYQIQIDKLRYPGAQSIKDAEKENTELIKKMRVRVPDCGKRG